MQDEQLAVELLVPYLMYEYVMGQSPSTETYDDRLMWQKVGHLAQQTGLALHEYSFTWCKAGPYSPAYTAVLFDITSSMDKIQQNAQNYSLSEKAKKKVKPIRTMISEKPASLSLPLWLESLSSILYLAKKSPFLDKKAILKKLVRLKPHLNQDAINHFAWDLLTSNHLL